MRYMIALVLALCIGIGQAQATVYWDDEMEAGTTGFSAATGGMTFDTSVKFSGTGSIRLDYPSNCYPDNISNQCGGFSERNHTGNRHIYTRFYVMFSSN